MEVYLALLHHPVYNKNKDIITTCITGFDLHDIARSALTFGVKKYFVVNPVESQLEFAGRIIKTWAEEESYVHNWTRAEALSRVVLKKDLAEVITQIKNESGKSPIIVATSARPNQSISFTDLKAKAEGPVLLLFGTGWGMTQEVLDQSDYILEPIVGADQNGYNHLSVRSAVAIILNRLLGR
ncbi:MAG: RNA methyltransferase [Candidatus Margulisbacteria bacterium]|nr:RNA methyltransferase [Candidatus Margulisiibacteriota bacterium]MBU1021752.1 RNA methyltransferase [Candidatus Margulisiibacteriota bacterium]MBU1729498.1 RNA methyltransferase [Candidatus Margulisiibacteriota bacterium]MBU1955401.1 RNA methyltransferase [Candidatus Margulisiibacteriota bacterium]